MTHLLPVSKYMFMMESREMLAKQLVLKIQQMTEEQHKHILTLLQSHNTTLEWIGDRVFVNMSSLPDEVFCKIYDFVYKTARRNC